ncbi:MAG: flagellar basal body rod C-terminal domain-containing protein [Candidatus Caenarcaniphilales bacterium]|nr:flagellar basal body rod C-terminal domain-containing protein [Candidatus Caenarcaniphilales bacterium]
MLFKNQKLDALKSSLKAAEDLRQISSINIANSSTLGYKALEGVFAPDCQCQCFSDLLPEVAKKMKSAGYSGYPSGEMHLEFTRNTKPGQKVNVNGKIMETSNVDPTKEFTNLITAASMTRSALSAIQLENKIQQETLNLGR